MPVLALFISNPVRAFLRWFFNVTCWRHLQDTKWLILLYIAPGFAFANITISAVKPALWSKWGSVTQGFHYPLHPPPLGYRSISMPFQLLVLSLTNPSIKAQEQLRLDQILGVLTQVEKKAAFVLFMRWLFNRSTLVTTSEICSDHCWSYDVSSLGVSISFAPKIRASHKSMVYSSAIR